jgi:hypothetical protein
LLQVSQGNWADVVPFLERFVPQGELRATLRYIVMMKGIKNTFIAALTIAGLLTAIAAMQATFVSGASVSVSLGSPQQNSHYDGVVSLLVSATYSGSGEVAFYSFYYYLDGNPGGGIDKTTSIFKTQLNLTPGEHQLRITANAFTKDQVAYTERTGSIPFIGIATGIAEVSFFVESRAPTSTPAPTLTPSPSPSLTSPPSPTPSPIQTPSPSIPEFPIWTAPPLVLVASVVFFAFWKSRAQSGMRC